jgi:hypothetical protein
LRLFGGKRTAPSQPGVAVDHDDVEEQPRPHTGSTGVATSSATDADLDEKDHVSIKRSRSRTRSVSQKLAVPVEAFTTALRDRARSRSRSKSLLPPKRPSEEDEKNLPSLPLSDDKPPRLSLGDEKALSQAEGDEEKRLRNVDLVTVSGPAWPMKEDKETRVDGDSGHRRSAGSKRADSVDSLDTPTSSVFSDEGEKKRVSGRLSVTKGDHNRDSKLKDEGLEDEDELPELQVVEKTEEQERKRKMRESRQKLKLETPKCEQDRLDMFQCM